ncbi:MAG: beta-1,6-N-acetylglucosaminyltransferase [Pseudomonadota bacterium]
MSVGFILLAHANLHRAVALMRWLDGQGAPVAIHVDRQVPHAAFAAVAQAVSECAHATLAPRRRSEWGGFGLVRATQGAAERLLADWPELRHICLISGACLPIRPLSELRAFLAAHPETDFIESEDARTGSWVKAGLSVERLTLRFPFSWRRHRVLFDAAVALQRRLGVSRRLPHGLTPRIGSQWWCLTRPTLEAVLRDPRRPGFDRFFALSWIPDETYFQSLARDHSRHLDSRSLTLSKFDHQGKPHSFYDDHLGLLTQADHFFARKIWSGADGLYRQMLGAGPPARGHARCRSHVAERPFAEVHRQRSTGRPGLLGPGRFPCQWHSPQHQTPGPYWVFEGFDALAPGWHRSVHARFDTALRGQGAPKVISHGRLFAPLRVELAGDRRVWTGNIPANPHLRDRDPDQYLIALLRQASPGLSGFQIDAEDDVRLRRFIMQDPNARILRIADHWLLRLSRAARGDMHRVVELAQGLVASGVAGAEPEHETMPEPKAQIVEIALADAVADPTAALSHAAAFGWDGAAFLGQVAAAAPYAISQVALATGYRDAARLREAERARAAHSAGAVRAMTISA